MDLFAYKDRAFSRVRTLTAEELDDFLDATERLYDFERSRLYIEMVLRNTAEFQGALAIRDTIGDQRGAMAEAQFEFSIEVNRRLVNYLTMARLFLDHSEIRLKRRYGALNPVVAVYKLETSRSYDDVFAYRFLYKLRNFSQHFGMPITHVTARSSQTPEKSCKRHELGLALDIRKLLDDGGTLWGPVRRDLEHQPEHLPVEPLVKTMTHELVRIENAIVNAEQPLLLQHAQRVVQVAEEVVADGAVPLVGTATPEDGGLQMEMSQAPADVMVWLGFDNFKRVV